MKEWAAFQIIRFTRRLELWGIRRRLVQNRQRLLKVVDAQVAPFKGLLEWINLSITDINAELAIWKQAKNYDHLHELISPQAGENAENGFMKVTYVLDTMIASHFTPEQLAELLSAENLGAEYLKMKMKMDEVLYEYYVEEFGCIDAHYAKRKQK